MIKRILFSVICLMILCSSICVAADEVNLIRNSSFEQLDSSGVPVDWFADAYNKREGISSYTVTTESKSGESAAIVENYDLNDARFAQTVAVEPNAMYRLSGWIKASNIDETGHGANLSVEGVHARSESLRDTQNEWQYVETYGLTGDDQTEVTVFVRVGGYSGESQGRACFDDISLVKVEELPAGVFAEAWYTIAAPQVIAPMEQNSAQEAGPAWPALLFVSVFYAVCAAAAIRYLQFDLSESYALIQSKHEGNTRVPAFVAVGLFIAAIARLVTALNVTGYQVDVNCFTAWGNTMFKVGPGIFYQSNWCDYTPGYIYVLGFNGWLSDLLQPIVSPSFVHKLVPIACDLIASCLIYRLAIEHSCSKRQAGIMVLIFAFNPAAFLNSSAWCQIDSVLCLGLMLVAYFAMHKNWAIVLPIYVLCILVKPQALMLGFLGLSALISEWFMQKDLRTKYLKQLMVGLAASAVIALIIVLPFAPNQDSPLWLINQYADTLSSYNHATVNTANIYYLAGANWVEIAAPASTGVIIFFVVVSLIWGIYTLLQQRRKVALWYIEPISMLMYAGVYTTLLLTGCSWTQLGWATMSMAFVLILPMFIRSGKMENLPLCGAAIFLLLYVFGIKMHERYLFPAIFLLGMAYAIRRDRRIFSLLVGATCVLFVNEGIVLDNSIRLGSSMGHLNQDTVLLANFLSVLNVTFALASIWICHQICVADTPIKLSSDLPDPRKSIPTFDSPAKSVLTYQASSKLHFGLKDFILVAIVTVIYSIVTLTTLGSTKAPQTAWKSSAKDEYVYVDLGKRYENFSMLYFCQVSYNNFAVAVSDDGIAWSEDVPVQMAEGQCFQWKYLKPSYTADGQASFVDVSDFADVQKLSGRYIRINPKQVGLVVNELIFKDEYGAVISTSEVYKRENANATSPLYSDPLKLLDEQDTLEGEPSWWNSTYFDEIYHARTAFEHLNQTNAYEWTHPPLGKVIMSWFIGLFGMTPFGWRFAGALCGIMMLPALYLLVKQLTKRTDMAFYGMMLMTLDCMHFTQTRLATIDSYPVLFIILSYFFMLRFMQRNIVTEPFKKILPDLACSGFFMGCGFASKWIGAYAGIGLAVLYFWTCARHILISREASMMLNQSEQTSLGLSVSTTKTIRRVVILCLWCILFFVAVPLTIYLLSYVVHFADREFESVGHFLKTVYQTNFGKYNSMLSYHGTPGLGMDHYYYSPWYEWPLMIKPMYYASAAFKPEGMTYAIFCFGNPWVWVIGIVGIAYTLYHWVSGHHYCISSQEGTWHLSRSNWDITPSFILIGLLAQFLPWVLVPRGTYIYHYFASIPFLILATVMMLHHITSCSPRLGKRLMIVHLVLCFVWFVLLFPYASGVMTPNTWMDFIRDYPYISLLPNYWESDLLVSLNTILEKIPVFPLVYHH